MRGLPEFRKFSSTLIPGDPMKIMIVDDNELMRKEIKQSVVRTDDVIMECADGESALANCLDFDPDWFLLDIRMGKMNGLTAAEKIKVIKPDAKIAFVTSYDLDMYRKAAKELGVQYYFLKSNMLKIRDMMNGDSDRI